MVPWRRARSCDRKCGIQEGPWHAGDLLLAAGSNSGEVAIFEAREGASSSSGGACCFSPCRVLMRAGHTDVLPYHPPCMHR